jgi:hypothetical protein
VPVQVLQRSGIALDVDEPRDMQRLLAALDDRAEGKTYKLLRGSELGARLELALATLDDERDSDIGAAK